MRRPFIVAAAAVAAGAIVLGACGGSESSSTSHGMSGMSMGEHDMAMPAGHAMASEVKAGAREVAVTGSAFKFEPAEIRVRAGEDLAIVLTATDLLHDLTIDELDTHVAAEPGKTAKGGLTAPKPGRYTYYCTVAGHRQAGMQGTLIVE